MEVAALGGCIACTVNGVRREAEVEPRLLIDYFLRESLGLTNIVKAIQSAAGDHARPGRCLRRMNHGARTAPRQGRG